MPRKRRSIFSTCLRSLVSKSTCCWFSGILNGTVSKQTPGRSVSLNNLIQPVSSSNPGLFHVHDRLHKHHSRFSMSCCSVALMFSRPLQDTWDEERRAGQRWRSGDVLLVGVSKRLKFCWMLLWSSFDFVYVHGTRTAVGCNDQHL